MRPLVLWFIYLQICQLKFVNSVFCQLKMSTVNVPDEYTLPRGVKTLRKLAYSNILKFSPPKTESFQTKIPIFFVFLLKI